MKKNKTSKYNIYYFANMAAQFLQIIPIYNKIGGYFITAYPFFETWIKMNLKFGLGSTKFVFKREEIDKKIKGILISQSATNLFPKTDNIIRVYTGHGVSDKQYETPSRKLNAESFDYFFLTGPKDLHRLELAIDDVNQLHKKIVPIGMIRSDNIINKIYDPISIKEKYGINNHKKIVLYTPTYKKDGGTLDFLFEKIINELKLEFNIIIRPHYYDKILFKKHLKYIKINKLNNVKYIYKFNTDLTELFTISDILIGDRSSVDYDFVFTGKPIIRIKGNYINYIKPPDIYDINKYCFHYDPYKNNLLKLAKNAIDDKEYSKRIVELRNNCFYFNDGKALERACNKINELLENLKEQK